MAFSPRSPWSRPRNPDLYSTVVVHGDEDDARGGGGPAPAENDDEEDPSSLPPLLQHLPKDFGGASFDEDDNPYSSNPIDASLSVTVVVKCCAPASTLASSRSPFLDLHRSNPRAAEDDPYSTFVIHATTRSDSASSPCEFVSRTFIRRSVGSSSPRESAYGTFICRTSNPHESFSDTFIRDTSGASSPRELVSGGSRGFGSSFWSPPVGQAEEHRQPSPLLQQQHHYQQRHSRWKTSVNSVPESVAKEDPSTKYELLHEFGLQGKEVEDIVDVILY